MSTSLELFRHAITPVPRPRMCSVLLRTEIFFTFQPQHLQVTNCWSVRSKYLSTSLSMTAISGLDCKCLFLGGVEQSGTDYPQLTSGWGFQGRGVVLLFFFFFPGKVQCNKKPLGGGNSDKGFRTSVRVKGSGGNRST